MEAFFMGEDSVCPPQPSRNFATSSTVYSPNSPFLPTHTEQNVAGDSSGGRNQTFQRALLNISRTLRQTSVEVKVLNECFAMVCDGVEQLFESVPSSSPSRWTHSSRSPKRRAKSEVFRAGGREAPCSELPVVMFHNTPG